MEQGRYCPLDDIEKFIIFILDKRQFPILLV